MKFDLKTTIEILTCLGTLLAVIIGLIAIYFSNKNSRDQILTSKLEELLGLIKTVAKSYSKLKELEYQVANLRNSKFSELETRKQYFEIRDEKLPINEGQKIIEKLSRIEVLAKCYTKNDVQESILKFEDLIYCMVEKATTAGSLRAEIIWKDGFPSREEFLSHLKEIESLIIRQIGIRK